MPVRREPSAQHRSYGPAAGKTKRMVQFANFPVTWSDRRWTLRWRHTFWCGHGVWRRRIGVVNHDVQIVRHHIGTLKAIAKGETPFKAGRRPGALTRGLAAVALAGPVEIGLNIVEGADADVRGRDDGFAWE